VRGKVLVVDGPAEGQVWDLPTHDVIPFTLPGDPGEADYWRRQAMLQVIGQTVTYVPLKIALFGRVVRVASCDRAVITGRASPDINSLWELLASDQAKECAEPVPPPAFGNGTRR